MRTGLIGKAAQQQGFTIKKNINKISVGMSDFGDSSSEESEEIVFVDRKSPTQDVSVIRHLPEARRIMQGQNYEQQISKCLYQQPLNSIPAMITPNPSNTQQGPLLNTRLNRLEEIMFEHVNMRQRIKGLLGMTGVKMGGKQYQGTLWSIYSTLTPSYARFGLMIRKSNYANVMMPINGVSIQLGLRPGHDKIAPIKLEEENISQFTMNPILRSDAPDTIRFDSHFESGNLLYAYRQKNQSEVSPLSPADNIQTYDLILQNDTNTKGHNQWFYFKVHNTKTHNRIRFNIVNFNKDESMFSYGIKPLTFSEKAFGKHKIGWTRDGQKVNYGLNKIKRENSSTSKCYYTFSFQYYFKEADTVYFSPSYPYTHSQLLAHFDSIMLNKSLIPLNIVSLKIVCESVGRNTVNYLTIGSAKRSIKDYKVVWVFGRQHPGETTASYMAEGMIDYLISLYSSPPAGLEYVLNNIVFKIAPMINVDGVIHGNTRAQLTGVDPNRMWKKPLKRLSPVVSSLKKLIATNKQNISLVLDLHSHSKKLGCFFYGNSLMHDPKLTKVYPTMVCEGDERFELKNCRFRGGYESTARSVLFNEVGIPCVYTVECSLLGYLKNKRIQEYRINDYHEMGKKLVDEYLKLEKTKTMKKDIEIIQDMTDRIPERDDADSARSQSSLSDYEYDEIIHRNKKKIKKKKVRKCANHDHQTENSQNVTIPNIAKKINEAHQPNKYFIRKNQNQKNSINSRAIDVLKQQKNSSVKQSASNLPNIHNKTIKDKTQTLAALKQNITKVLPDQSESALAKKCNRLINTSAMNRLAETQKKTLAKRDRAQTDENQIGDFRLETKDMEIQACIEDPDSQTRCLKNKKQRNEMLCVVGSSLEDDFICAYKNDVSTQVFAEVIQQQAPTDKSNSYDAKKTSKYSKKAPKFLNYLCSNLMGVGRENSVLPQNDKKTLAPIANRKVGNKI